MINLSSTADIIYSKKDNAEKTDIIYLKSGKQIEGRVVDRNAEQVKIEVESTKNLAAIEANQHLSESINRIRMLLSWICWGLIVFVQ